MKFNLKHYLALVAGTALPAAWAAGQGEPLSWATAGKMASAFVVTLFAVFLGTPIVDPGVQK